MLKKIIVLGVLVMALSACMRSTHTNTLPIQKNPVQAQLASLELSAHGRLGVAVINTADESTFTYRGNESFPFCSTFKFMVASAILKQSMTDPSLLQQRIFYTQKMLKKSGYAPVTKKYLKQGMTVSELAAAAVEYSDNVAVNILVKKLGGRKAVTRFARSIGDQSFRLDRDEPKLNSVIPHDLRDTTTPLAMAQSLQKIVLGNILGQKQRQLLQTWLQHNTTGDKRIRAGVPPQGWIVGDKTGTGDYGTTNDIAVLWPPRGAPIVIAIYFTRTQKEAAPNDAVIAEATKIVMAHLAETD